MQTVSSKKHIQPRFNKLSATDYLFVKQKKRVTDAVVRRAEFWRKFRESHPPKGT